MSWLNTLLYGAAPLISSLSQYETNGLSNLGTLQASTLPLFLTNNPLPGGVPWGNTKPTQGIPNTGVIRSYDFTITRQFKSPDGFNKSSILINNHYPGPLIEANWGDTIQVTVHNQIEGPEEPTSLHWHGQPQKLNPWADGVPSVSQCPIAPGSTFTYSFRAESFGSSWYHSHVSAQYLNGIFGPLVIYGPTNAHYDIDLGPVILNDYTHADYTELMVDMFAEPPVFIRCDNNLINGKMAYDCSLVTDGTACKANAGISKFKFTAGKTHRLRLINAGGQGTQKFSIDNHILTVIANDYVPIVPYNTTVVTLGVGQRSDVLVHATGSSTDAVWMRSDLDTDCINLPLDNSQPNALAAVYYNHADHNAKPNTTAYTWVSNNCNNDPLNLTVPFYPIQPPATPDFTHNVDITAQINETGHLLFYVDNSSFHADYNAPILLLANLGNTSYPNDPQWNVHNYGTNGSMRLIIRNFFNIHHPMHLHGHDFWVLAEGVGDWDGTITNANNPQRRDVHILQPGSPDVPTYIVIEFMADNPGVWPLHCHLVIHVSGGLYMNVMERPDLITERQIPSIMAQTCRDWAAWSGTHVVDEIDSGL